MFTNGSGKLFLFLISGLFLVASFLLMTPSQGNIAYAYAGKGGSRFSLPAFDSFFETDEGGNISYGGGSGRSRSFSFSSTFFDFDFIFKIKDYRAMEDDQLSEMDRLVH